MIEIIPIVVIPVARGIAGWLEKALADGEISEFEWKQLGETILRIGVPAAALCYGFQLPVGYAVCIPLVTDYVYSYIKKLLIKLKKK